MLKRPKVDITKLMELHGGADKIAEASKVVEREADNEPTAVEAEEEE
jgi:hypothetical protein